jgi:hypothetical protein
MDEDVLCSHPLGMHGGQMPVLYGCTIPLSWFWVVPGEATGMMKKLAKKSED